MHQTCMILTDIELEDEYTDRNDDINLRGVEIAGDRCNIPIRLHIASCSKT